MPEQITNYKCPACTGPLHFDAGLQKLSCEYCGSAYELQEIEDLYAKANEKAEAAKEKADKKEEELRDSATEYEEVQMTEDGMKSYNCPSCGAELICDESTAATCCPYCGNPSIVPGQFAGALMPQKILPFSIDKNGAIAALNKHYEGKVLLPSVFKDQNHIDDIQGVYVPFWLFDQTVSADVSFHGTKSTRRETATEVIIDTKHYDVNRAGTVSFENIPVDASKKMPDDYMDSIEPFDFSKLKAFSKAYLPGFLADKFDVSEEEDRKRADVRAKNSSIDVMRNDVGSYESLNVVNEITRIMKSSATYAMIPVWMLSTSWNGNNYLFAVNGQTGKVAGDLPEDKGKYWKYFALTFAITEIIMIIGSMFIF